MPRTPIRNGNGATRTGANKYDAHHKVLSQTYGAFADLRRELSDSKNTVTEREDILKSFAPSIRPEYPLLVATLLINKHIAVMTMPGEPFVEFQMTWRDRCPASDAFFLGYANGYYGYFPTIQAATEGGYGAASATTWMEASAGEQMVNHALVKLYEMLGRLTDLPEDLKKK